MNDVVSGARPLIGIDGMPLRTIPGFDPEVEHKADILARVGDLDDLDLGFNEVAVAKYIRARVSESLIASEETRREDVYQGSVGLVLKVGPRAYQDDAHNKFHGWAPKRGDWVLYRSSDGWDKDVQCIGEYTAVKCRFLQDAEIRGIVKYPGRWF